ncbi:hypothetical protein [Nostoc sp. 106C]|uniref:hypothetical protein n=1 Tax=Nostoc sp. 106C TaxID=1932667 RepID=UPI00117D849B|nr:hypothetical protein [Nostoc sp. 106C]
MLPVKLSSAIRFEKKSAIAFYFFDPAALCLESSKPSLRANFTRLEPFLRRILRTGFVVYL